MQATPKHKRRKFTKHLHYTIPPLNSPTYKYEILNYQFYNLTQIRFSVTQPFCGQYVRKALNHWTALYKLKQIFTNHLSSMHQTTCLSSDYCMETVQVLTSCSNLVRLKKGAMYQNIVQCVCLQVINDETEVQVLNSDWEPNRLRTYYSKSDANKPWRSSGTKASPFPDSLPQDVKPKSSAVNAKHRDIMTKQRQVTN